MPQVRHIKEWHDGSQIIGANVSGAPGRCVVRASIEVGPFDRGMFAKFTPRLLPVVRVPAPPLYEQLGGGLNTKQDEPLVASVGGLFEQPGALEGAGQSDLVPGGGVPRVAGRVQGSFAAYQRSVPHGLVRPGQIWNTLTLIFMFVT